MRESPEELQRRMARLRSEVSEDVESVFDTAEELTDWRHYVRRYPWVTVTAAAAVGFVLAPSRSRRPPARRDLDRGDLDRRDFDFDAFLDEAQRRGLVIDRAEQASSRPSWVGSVLRVVGPLVLRQAMRLATHKLEDFFERRPPPASDDENEPWRRGGAASGNAFE